MRAHTWIAIDWKRHTTFQRLIVPWKQKDGLIKKNENKNKK